jgi:Zn-dependent M32 family carboxypeptidase
MHDHVHAFGASHTLDGLLQAAAGRALDPSAFLAHLRACYLDAP